MMLYFEYCSFSDSCPLKSGQSAVVVHLSLGLLFRDKQKAASPGREIAASIVSQVNTSY